MMSVRSVNSLRESAISGLPALCRTGPTVEDRRDLTFLVGANSSPASRSTTKRSNDLSRLSEPMT